MVRKHVFLAGLIVGHSACAAYASDSSLTIYNQNFGVIRQSLHLSLKKGVNRVSFNEITSHLEPDSVILRDKRDGRSLEILEQNYRADPIAEPLLLSLNE